MESLMIEADCRNRTQASHKEPLMQKAPWFRYWTSLIAKSADWEVYASSRDEEWVEGEVVLLIEEAPCTASHVANIPEQTRSEVRDGLCKPSISHYFLKR